MAKVLPFFPDHDDDIFFHKHQLRIGTALRYCGRIDPGSLWFVSGVYTGQHIQRKETFPQRLDDLVRLRNYQTDEVRFMRFVYLSYSAIWQIDE